MNTFTKACMVIQAFCIIATFAVILMPMTTFRKIKKWYNEHRTKN